MLTKISNNSLSAISTLPSAIPVGALTLIKTQTASDVVSVEFKHGTNDVVFDSTYKVYVFKYIEIHPENEDASELKFQVSTDTGTTYGQNITSTSFQTTHTEDGATANVVYVTSQDLAQSTDFQHITANNIGNAADENASGTFTIYDPSNTTFVKHFMSRNVNTRSDNRCNDVFNAGYINTTSAIDAIKFSMMNGQTEKTMDGVFKMYGVS